MSAKNFACSLTNAKKSFYRAFNAVCSGKLLVLR